MKNLLSALVYLLCTTAIYCQSWDVCYNRETQKYGICYADTVKVPQIYDFAQFISSHEFIVAKDGKYGTMDRYSNYLIQPVYDKIWEFTELSNSLLVQQGNLYGIINMKGKTIVPLYQIQEGEINTFHTDSHLSFAHPTDNYQAIHDGKMAIYNMEGKMIFDFIYPFVQDILVQPADAKKPSYYIFLVGEPGKYSFADAKNKLIFRNIEVEDMYNVYHNWGVHTKGMVKNGNVQFVNVETGAFLNIEEMHNMLDPFNLVQNLEDKMGAIGENGQIRIPCIYNNIIELPEVEFVTVELNHKKGLVNLDGEILLEPIYENVAEICFDGMDPTLFPYEVDNGKWLAVFVYNPATKKMEPKTKFIYSDISCFEVTKEGLKAYLTDSAGRKGFLLPNGTIQMGK